MTDDAALLRRYAEERSEAAFAELVHRHLNFVYTAALRQARGNTALVEDAVQTVFADLAGNAARLSRHAAVVGWLHSATRFAVAKAIRSEVRRQSRERKAHAVNEALREDKAAVEWEMVKPVIDDVLSELKERERLAVLLRYFEKRSLAEVGARLALTDTAARSCIDRALAKMQQALLRRGVTSTAGALGMMLAQQANATAPAAMAGGVIASALSAATAPLLTGTALGGATFLSMAKSKPLLIAALIVSGAAVISLEFNKGDAPGHAISPMLLPPAIVKQTPTQAQADPGRSPPASKPTEASPVSVPRQPRPETPTNPAAGMTRVENLTNVGRATPAAAFQTMIWAAMKGDDNEFTASLTLSNEAREKAAVWRAGLPPESQTKFTPLEKLPALFLAEEFLRKAVGLQVLGLSEEEGNRATLHVRTWTTSGGDSGFDQKFAMIKGSNGWQMVITETMIGWMSRKD